MLAARRRLDGLVVDAGVGHRDAELDEGRDRAPLQVEHRGGLAEHAGFREVGAARIGDGRDAHAALAGRRLGEPLEPAHAGLAEAFGVGHDVRLRHRHEIGGAEEIADRDLVAQRLLRDRAVLAGENVLLFVVQFHSVHSIVAPDSRTALPHLASSRRWKSAKSPRRRTVGTTPSGSSLPRKRLAARDAGDRVGQRRRQIVRQSGGREHAPPRGRLEVRDNRIPRSSARSAAPASAAARQRDGAQLAALDVRQHGLQRIEHDLDLAADQIGHRGCAAPVGHVLDVHACRALEHLAGQVARRAVAGRSVGQLAG